MPPPDQRAERFHYDGFTIDPVRGEICCRYSTGGHGFTEGFAFGPDGRWDDPATHAAARMLFLLAGVSYYKTTAARIIDLGSTTSTPDERAFLTRYYVHGLGEFAYRNNIDLSDLLVEGPEAPASSLPQYIPTAGRPLIPFGGGIDSIVTVAALCAGPVEAADAALCIVHPPGDRFAAIEDAAAVTGVPVVRVTRRLDPLVRRSEELGFFNGHVPITAVISAAAVVAAVLDRRDAVVLSNESSASVPTLLHAGQPINHQWSKGIEFEQSFAHFVAGSLGPRCSLTCGPAASYGWRSSSLNSASSMRSSGAVTGPSIRIRPNGWITGVAPATSAASSISSWLPSCPRHLSAASSTATSLWRSRGGKVALPPCSDWRPTANHSSAWATSTSAAPRWPWWRHGPIGSAPRWCVPWRNE